MSSEPPSASKKAIVAGEWVIGSDTGECYRECPQPQSYLCRTATLTVKVSRPPGGTRCRPVLCSGAFAGPIQGSTQ